ncbi:MAG TPA: (2Fe-2S)-binding protein [Sphingomonas sp.]|uniref:(2Fe-2S)-binding protein n=1 Tax=Sphingomonas sp. TaxID=28214 RepID=UPI002BBF98A4|nr:(2Fe-2S)-binding protein [Sphingomonas sp.]HMI18461.1 (2Fe-2S)-binding protein [Sphingomonas sp.]
MTSSATLNVDGSLRRFEIDDPDMPLLYALRDQLGLNNPRFGCGLAQCGACTVHVDGEPTRSCVTPLSSVEGRNITTMAGLGTPDHPHALQLAFVKMQATQCGYCINGWIMTAAALVRDNPTASIADIKEALSGLKCRCGTHQSIVRAVATVTGALK